MRIKWKRLPIVIPLIPITLLALFWEWWHFGPSQRILRMVRRYNRWLASDERNKQQEKDDG